MERKKSTKPYPFDWPVYESRTSCTFVTGPTAEKKGLKSSSVASYLILAKNTLLGTSLSSLRRAFSPTVPPVFLKVTRLVFLRLTRISIVVVVARRSVAGKWVRRAAKGRVRVAVKRRRSVRIVVAACGDGVCCCCIVCTGAAMVLLLFSVCRQRVASSVWVVQVSYAAMPRV